MPRTYIPRFIATIAATLAAITLVSGSAIAANPAKLFPDFASQKPKLGSIAMLTDLIVVEDVIGTTEKVYLVDCHHLGEAILGTFADGLGPKGYSFSRKSVVSIGNVLNDKLQYRLLQTWDQHKKDDAQFPVVTPPFYEDSSLSAAGSSRSAWHAVLNGVWAFKKEKGKPAPPLAEIAGLHEAIGTDYALIIVVVGTKVPFGKQLGQGMLSNMTHVSGSHSGSSGTVSVNGGLDFTQYSGTGIRMAVVDCKTGEVMWADGDHEGTSLSEDRLEKLSKDVLKRMP